MNFDDKLIIGGGGYIGSALVRPLSSNGIVTTDLKWDIDYDTLDSDELDELKDYKTIILLAGHSSVSQCIEDPSGAWDNNVSKFQRLLDKISPDQTFIYASSGSVYNWCPNITEDNNQFNLTTMYDLTKYTIDKLAQLSGKNFYGLRFGTVCGYSPVMRNDLMINRMYANRASGTLTLSNLQAKRPILAMSDLIRAVKAIMADPTHPGLYNLKSFTKTIGEIGVEVAASLDLAIETEADKPTYDFDMDTTKFQQTYNFMFNGTIQSILRSLQDEQNPEGNP